MLTTGDLLADPGYWYDPDHLNLQGAAALSARLGGLLAEGPPGGALRANEPAPCAPGKGPGKGPGKDLGKGPGVVATRIQ